MDSTRAKNFSSVDINTLLSLVQKYVHILENKKTDRIRPDQKENAWKEIESDFNAISGEPFRSAKILKTKYANLKADMKKRAAAQKRSLYGTGGGPHLNHQTEDFDSLLRQIVPDKQVEGITSQYDSDVLEKNLATLESADITEMDDDSTFENLYKSNKKQRTAIPPSTSMDNSVVVQTIEEDNAEYNSWEKYTARDLKTAKHKKLSSEKVHTKTSWTKLAEIKTKYTETKLKQETELSKTEHDLRIAHMTEMHNLHKQFAIEEHELKMRILRQQLDCK